MKFFGSKFDAKPIKSQKYTRVTGFWAKFTTI